MNGCMKKILAAVLSCTVLLGAGVTAWALADQSKNEEQEPETAEVSAPDKETRNEKDETVYVLVGADGSVKKIIVSDWIKNTLGSASVADKTELSDIVNVKGDESYSVNGDNMKVWDAEGNDIYYQGNIEKELPVDLRVSYTLDGSPISVAELAGKSAVVLGAGLTGIELAIYLKERGVSVEIAEMAPETELSEIYTAKMAEIGLEIKYNTRAKEITDAGALCETPEGERLIAGEIYCKALFLKLPNRDIQPDQCFSRAGHSRYKTNALFLSFFAILNHFENICYCLVSRNFISFMSRNIFHRMIFV